MPTFVVRVWLPDPPGALGAVASRIGAVRGDLVSIDILERGSGRAIDELVVELPSEELIDLLVAEMSQVDGVDVEEVRATAPGAIHDPRLDALETAAMLVEQDSAEALVQALAAHVHEDFDCEWAGVLDAKEPGALLAGVGPCPSVAWLLAFFAGTQTSMLVASGETGPDDVAYAPLPGTDLALVLGRAGRPFRSRERRQLVALARVAGRRTCDLDRPAASARPDASGSPSL